MSASDDDDEIQSSLLGNEQRLSETVRRKAAEAALRRAGAMAQRARPKSSHTNKFDAHNSISQGMRWEGG